jgi:hypothetical protein
MAKRLITGPVVVAVFVFAAAFFSLPQNALAAFGVSPPFLNADHLIAGAKYVQTVYLVQDQPDQDLEIKARLDVPDKIRPWIKIDKGFDFVIPKGVRQFPIQIEVDIPQSETLGQYSGNLIIVSAPAQTGQVTIALGANIAINLTVGTGIFEKFSVPVLKPLDIEEGWNPRVYVKFNNEGNIPASFGAATFELLDKYGGARLAFIQKSKDFPETPPFTIKEYTVDFPVDFHLGLGQYWADIAFYKNDKVVANQKTVFSVLPAGSLSSPLSQISDYFKNNWLYLLGVVLLAVIIFTVWRKKRAG